MTVKVSPKFQVVIPEEIRNSLGIEAGSRMEVIAKGKVIYLVPVQTLEEVQKSLKGKMGSENFRDKKDRIL